MFHQYALLFSLKGSTIKTFIVHSALLFPKYYFAPDLKGLEAKTSECFAWNSDDDHITNSLKTINWIEQNDFVPSVDPYAAKTHAFPPTRSSATFKTLHRMCK